MHDKTIIFLDDSVVFNAILVDGYFDSHPIKDLANLKAYTSTLKLLNELDDINAIDYFVVDYHMPGADGATVKTIIKHRYPKAKIWLYTGMPFKYIRESDKTSFNRIIGKDNGIPYLLDALLEDIKYQ